MRIGLPCPSSSPAPAATSAAAPQSCSWTRSTRAASCWTPRRLQEPADLTDRGATARPGDFDDPASLPGAFAGGERLLLISTDAVGRRVPQHRTAIEAGVRAVAHTSLPSPGTTARPRRCWRRAACSGRCCATRSTASTHPRVAGGAQLGHLRAQPGQRAHRTRLPGGLRRRRGGLARRWRRARRAHLRHHRSRVARRRRPRAPTPPPVVPPWPVRTVAQVLSSAP